MSLALEFSSDWITSSRTDALNVRLPSWSMKRLGGVSWWFGMEMRRPEERTMVRSPEYLDRWGVVG